MDDARAKTISVPRLAGREQPGLDVGFDACGEFDTEDDRRDEIEAADAADFRNAAATETGTGAGVCPHVDRNDARCGHRFSLGRIEQAFSVCFGAFHACPHFHRISGEVAIADGFVEERVQPLVEIRVIAGAGAGAGTRLDDRRQDRSVGAVAGLRRTGT